MIHSDKFFVGIKLYEPTGGLWCVVCLAANRRPALVCEFEAERTLAYLVSEGEAHWAQVHEPQEVVEPRLLVHRYVSVDPDVTEDAEGEDEDGQTHPAQSDAAGEVAGRQDQQDRGNDVKDHSQHVRFIPRSDPRPSTG